MKKDLKEFMLNLIKKVQYVKQLLTSKISNFNGLEDILKILFMNIRIRFLSSEQDLMNGELTKLVGINVGNHN